jgi:uncharacterized protein (DUF1015 family)
MARFRPFRGIRFVGDRVGPLERIVAPPYDVITEQHREALYRAGPYNVARLIVNREGHDQAAALFRAWREQEVLREDPYPCFYLYRQDFEHRGPRRRSGIIGALHLEPFERGVVRPHEQTFAHHKRDRLELTKRTKANLSAIFGLYGNAEFYVEPEGGWSEAPEIDVMHEGVRNRLWLIRSSAALARITAAVKDRTVFIADGHHRYETALNYYAATHGGESPPASEDAPEDRENPAAHVMTFLATFEDPGMLVLPTHRELPVCSGADVTRFLATIEKDFEVEAVERSPGGRQRVMELLESSDATINLFVVAFSTQPAYYVLRRKVPRRFESAKTVLDVTVLHSSLLTQFGLHDGPGSPKVEYSPDTDAVLDRVESGRSAGAFLLRALQPEQMAAVCADGELLPQKSTFFYPKLLTGLVFHDLEP